MSMLGGMMGKGSKKPKNKNQRGMEEERKNSDPNQNLASSMMENHLKRSTMDKQAQLERNNSFEQMAE